MQIDDHRYVYVFVRRDIPLNHQIAQACHGALEAGRKFPNASSDTNSIIVIGCKNQKELLKARDKVTGHGIKSEMFFEPDWEYGDTSFGTEPVSDSERHLFRSFQCWKP